MSAPGPALPKIGEPPPLPATDDKASAEAAGFGSGRLERSDTRDKHLHYCALVFIWIAFLGFLAASAVWLWHLILPHNLHFLSDADRSTLQNVLFTAVGSAAAGGYGKKYLNGVE